MLVVLLNKYTALRNLYPKYEHQSRANPFLTNLQNTLSNIW